MVLEVKSGSLDYSPKTGRWNTDDHDHPVHQLDMEWKAVVNEINEHRGNRKPLFVGKALAVPQLELDPSIAGYLDGWIEFSGRAKVRTVWIIDKSRSSPRLVTAYPGKR
jgi:hypothetical protein